MSDEMLVTFEHSNKHSSHNPHTHPKSRKLNNETNKRSGLELQVVELQWQLPLSPFLITFVEKT